MDDVMTECFVCGSCGVEHLVGCVDSDEFEANPIGATVRYMGSLGVVVAVMRGDDDRWSDNGDIVGALRNDDRLEVKMRGTFATIDPTFDDLL